MKVYELPIIQDKSPIDTIKQIGACLLICFIVRMGMDENTFLGFSASELRAKVFSLEETKFLKRKTADPLNANEQDSPPIDN